MNKRDVVLAFCGLFLLVVGGYCLGVDTRAEAAYTGLIFVGGFWVAVAAYPSR